MKLTLQVQAIDIQGDIWCYDASLFNAINIRIFEKYKITKKTDLQKFYDSYFFENMIVENIFAKFKKEYKIPEYTLLKEKFYRKLSKPKIEKILKKGVPVIVQLQKWGVQDDIIIDGINSGHYFVLYGFDDEFYYLQNPWGEEHYSKIKKQDKDRIGSFTLII